MKKVRLLLIVMAALGLAITASAAESQHITPLIPGYVAPGGTDVTGDITTSAYWPAYGSPYHLRDIINVKPGATLHIEAGTVIANYLPDDNPGQDEKGSVIVNRGAKIVAKGTHNRPIIFTSAEDVATWDGNDVGTRIVRSGVGDNYVTQINVPNADSGEWPYNNWVLENMHTGEWRPVCEEWGSLAICGQGYISASEYEDAPVERPDGSFNSEEPNCFNVKRMEGTVVDEQDPTANFYGGCDDDDNSGMLCYVSLRYGGDVIIDTDELNGLSLGAVGRGTDICHVEVMNNVDDGIELWGGTVCPKYLNVWNIGDDSIDFDEGYRGCMRYGLIVQGYSQTGFKQGSGVGDNCFEMDGAEEAWVQPRSTVKICNFTAIGQPGTVSWQDPDYPDGYPNHGGDGGTTWRDNARVQFCKCVWMDVDDELVKFDNADKDGASGYDGTASLDDAGQKLWDNDPADGTLNWLEHWGTSIANPHGYNGGPTFNEWLADTALSLNGNMDPELLPNIYTDYFCCAYEPNEPLCFIRDSVFFNIRKLQGEMAEICGVLQPHNGNTVVGTISEDNMPIQELVRTDEPVTITAPGKDPLDIARVTWLNPCAANDALTVTEPNCVCCNCCCDYHSPAPAPYAGGFSGCYNWLAGWTAADAFGMTDTSMNDVHGDSNCDGKVDFYDLDVLGDDWLYN